MEKELNQSRKTAIKQAEFDRLADDYYDQHRKNIAITGESPEYFSEYKIADIANTVSAADFPPRKILDFGCGIGNSVPYFRKYFPAAELSCVDVSSRSIDIAKQRFPGQENYILIDDGRIPIESNSQDIVFSACVLHHIPHEEHAYWLSELHRVARPGGLLFIFEHNPLNPLTVRAVNTCPLDENAQLIRAGRLKQFAMQGGWANPSIQYRLFFPSMAAALRPLENYLDWLCLGAQYRLAGIKSV